MRNVLRIGIGVLAVTLLSSAATRGDVKILEASEQIRYLSQKIAKSYLYCYKNPKKIEVHRQVSVEIANLEKNLEEIASITKDPKTKSTIEFIAHSKEQIKQIVAQKADQEKAALMLDYSETLLEGVDAITKAHTYEFSEGEKMLMTAKELEYLLERLTKYYLASHTGFNILAVKEQMNDALRKLEENMQTINSYAYPDKLAKKRKQLNKFWQTSKAMFTRAERLFVPNLILNAVAHMEENIDAIILYHKKNQ